MSVCVCCGLRFELPTAVRRNPNMCTNCEERFERLEEQAFELRLTLQGRRERERMVEREKLKLNH